MNTKFLGKSISVWLNYFLVICIVIGCILHIVPYFYNRALWVDEAMLASSICTRDLNNLVADPLDWGQSASVGYLYIVKLLTCFWGTSETVLRIYSLITSFGCIYVLYLLLKENTRKTYALFFTAIFSLTDMYIYYGNEFKPYMSDNLCCLVALYLWQKYRTKTISLLKLTLIYSVLIWFSFSAVFIIAACMIIECLTLIKQLLESSKHPKTLFHNLLKCGTVLISFIFYFVFWLSKTAGNVGGGGYWDLLNFPLIPTSLGDLKLILKMFSEFFVFYPNRTSVLIGLLVLLYIINSIIKKDDHSKTLLPTLVSIILLFIASYLGFYPIQSRLVQVYGIIMLVFCGYMCNEIESIYLNYLTKPRPILFMSKLLYCAILCVFLGITGLNGCKNLSPTHIYKYGSEVAKCTEYLNENLKQDDYIYVYGLSIPVFMYEMDYVIDYAELNKLPKTKPVEASWAGLPYQNEHIIYGQMLFSYDYKIPYNYDGHTDMLAIAEDANLIKNNDSVYLYTSHGESGFSSLIEELEKHGTVTVVVDSYATHLYHYSQD